MSSANVVSELASKLSSVSMGKPQPPPKPQTQQPPKTLPRPGTRLHPTIPDPTRRDTNAYVDVDLNPEQPYETVGKKEQEDYENACMIEPEEYVFDSNDSTRATGLLQAKRAGTFLVRNAQTGPGKVLNVQSDTSVKKFKITEKDDGTVSLDNTEFFKNIGQMVTVYTRKSLPSKELHLKLYKGYNA